jgi:hypothetical protein
MSGESTEASYAVVNAKVSPEAYRFAFAWRVGWLVPI